MNPNRMSVDCLGAYRMQCKYVFNLDARADGQTRHYDTMYNGLIIVLALYIIFLHICVRLAAQKRKKNYFLFFEPR